MTTLRELAPPDALVARVGDVLVDLSRASDEFVGGDITYLDPSDAASLHVMRHSAAHVMAQAVLRLHPEAKYAIGPSIENGFYYDFELDGTLAEDDLEAIEAEMRKIVAEDQIFVREEMPRLDAVKLFSDDVPQPFKVEILEGGDEDGQVKVGEVVTLYRNPSSGGAPDGASETGFTDLCLGPHVPSTSHIGHFKLLRVSGAYWRGDEKRPQLQRVYGTTWPTAEALEDYLRRLEEAERRDHRKLGRDLDLFSSPPEVGAGMFVWHPKGGLVRKLLEDYSREAHLRRGYDIVASPHVGREELFSTSGHLEQYADNMFPPMSADEATYYLKPMNCPFHALIYRSKTRSYRDLPMRLSELAMVYRHERSGTLHGLMRVRSLTQDDSHIFCTPDQLVDEILGVMDFTVDFYGALGLKDPVVHLSTRPGKAIGTPEMWKKAEEALTVALERSPFDFDVAEGEGAFYGPKIDFDFPDAIGRLWQLTTIQCDFSTPERFGLEYIGADNQPHTPVMVHRALYGAVERFFGVLLEHTAGALPPWVAPVQIRIIPMREAPVDDLAKQLRDVGFRVDVDDANESMQYRVRRGTVEKVPWLLIVGPKELESQTVSVRTRTGTDRRGVALEDFVAEARELVDSRAVDVG